MVSKIASRLILLFLLPSKLLAENIENKVHRTLKTVEIATIRRCSYTSITEGYHNNVFFNSTCPPDDDASEVESNICGTDDLKFGRILLKKFGDGAKEKTLYVTLQGTNLPYNLFSIYFLPIGADACTEKVFVGNIMTDRHGNTGRNGKLLRDCGKNPWPACLNNKRSLTNAVDPFDEGFLPDVGFLFIYSRGISRMDGVWLTRDGSVGAAETPFGVLENRRLWNDTDQFGGIQYIAALG